MPIISKRVAKQIEKLIDQLTDGGGVTAPDDMVSIDDIADILEDFWSLDEKVNHHAEVVEELTELYERKNHDYGDSFGQGMKKYGMVMPIIRIEDKINRLAKLAIDGGQMVKDESLRDTLLDLANYSVMTVVEMDLRKDMNK